MKHLNARLIVLLGSLFATSPVLAQTEWSGQVNVYARLGAQDRCDNTITLDDISGFQPGMGVVLIQMNGASINTSNSAAYGDITQLGSTGQYEYNEITAVTGNVLTLSRQLVHDYDTDFTQVIGFEIAAQAIVTGPVTAPAWDGNTGGVVVLVATEQLELAAAVDVSGRGFQGGRPGSPSDNNCNWLFPQTNYAYNSPNWRGAAKGEGVAPTTQATTNGRGAQANGGGGGNDHNTGGGGGGNVSSGGNGGRNDEPSTFGCRGIAPGIGGKALPADDDRIYMGGGGGTGHSNNDDDTAGGPGGGILLIRTNQFIFNGGSLRANGSDGSNAVGDGAGGGGAGGSIVLVANLLTGTPDIQARGGNGGQVNNGNVDRCFGPGGGGSGGWLRTSLPMAANLDGGSPGLTTNSTSCSTGTNEAQAGNTGIQRNIADLPMGELFAPSAFVSITSDTTVCIGAEVSLTALFDGNFSLYQWQSLSNGVWTNISVANDTVYTFVANTAATYRAVGNVQYCPSESAIISPPVTVTVAAPAMATPTYQVVGNTATFNANVTGEATILDWQWGEITVGSGSEVTFTFPGPGSYDVVLTLVGPCTQEQYPVSVVIAEPLIANIAANRLTGCAPLAVVFEDVSTGTIVSRSWEFPGGDPATGEDATMGVLFTTPGVYTIGLSVNNGTATATATTIVEVLSPPLPDFSFEVDGLQVAFTNTTQNASSYTWNFGDGNSSHIANPIHTYSVGGIYEVTLSTANTNCGVAVSQTVSVMIVGTKEVQVADWRTFPNPARERIHIDFRHPTSGQLLLHDAVGRIIQQHRLAGTTEWEMQLAHLPAGTYYIRLLETDGRMSVQAIIVE